ncbi:MAG: auxin-responsive protein [Planctomyces sp.]|nr:auxin-responsive protein [Planctomyces sp.]
MGTRSILRAVAGPLLRTRMRKLARGFLASTADCRRVQHEVLSDLISLNARSRFSTERGLDKVRTPGEFRSCLSISTYEDYRSSIERLKIGDQAALLGPDNPLMMFTLSSGTTDDSKFIPVTRRFLDDYRRGWKTWAIMAYDDHPRANAQNIVQFVSHHEQFHTEGGTPCGNISGLAVAMQSKFVRRMYSIPFAVARIKDPDAKYYAALRCAVADDNVGMVTTANPSTLLQVARFADANRDTLIRDIADGTLSGEFDISDDIRTALAPAIKRQRQRAAELEQIVSRTGHLYPRDFWNTMQILAVWTGGSCAAYLDSVRECYGDVPTRDHGLSASEGRMTIPLEDGSASGVLDIVSNYFEFIPAEQYGGDDPEILEAHELEVDRDYYILLTTASGLYRYDICDVVRCTGFCGTTPLLQFLHKGAHISNITGEKLSESQIIESVRESAIRLDLGLDQFTAMPVWGEPPGYHLAVEHTDLSSCNDLEQLARQIDERLQELNCEYREKRATGRLAPLQLAAMPEGTWSRFASNRQAKIGGSIEQYKHPCLIPDLEAGSNFFREYAGDPNSGMPPVSAAT